MPADEIQAWIASLRDGDEQAASRLWEQFHRRLHALAEGSLRGARNRAADADDVVSETFALFLQRARDGRVPELPDEEDLWAYLAKIARRRATDQVRREGRQKRGDGKVRGDSYFTFQLPPREGGSGFDQVAAAEPGPVDLVALGHSLEELFAPLGPEERLIALCRLEGRGNDEIAGLLGMSRATIERRLRDIRDHWRHLEPDE